jgi:hypothetical protein
MATSGTFKSSGRRAPAKRKRSTGFTPTTTPTMPPPGYYDPGLEAQFGAAERGYGDLTEDTSTGNLRAGGDYQLGNEAIDRATGRTLGDIMIGRQRSAADTATRTQGLQRQFTNLGNVQAQQQAYANALPGSGAMAESMRKRAANQAIGQQAIDTQAQRETEGFNTAETRTIEDAGLQKGANLLGFTRGTDDRNLALRRGGRELTQFGLDTSKAAFGQAKQMGWAPPPVPGNEFTSKGGTVYRVLKRRTGGNVFQMPSGRRSRTRPT